MRRLILKVLLVAVAVLRTFSEFSRQGASFFVAVIWGISTREEITNLTRKYWNRDPEMKKEDYVLGGLFAWETKLYEAHLPPTAIVGLIGCGTGRDLIGLARKGYRVEGVDLSPEMLRVAQDYLAQTGIEGGLHCADIYEFEFPSGSYDALIFSNCTYTLIPGSSRRVELLKRLRSRLFPQGSVILTYWNSQERQDSRSFRVARWFAKISRNPDLPENGDQLFPNYEFGHFFTHDEIEGEAKNAGYDVYETYPLSGRLEFAAILKPSSPSSS